MESAVNGNHQPSPKRLGQLGRDEMNLAEFPITLLTDRVPKDQTTAVYQDEHYDERTGRTLTRKLTISAGAAGLTTAVDDEVILAFIQITRQQNDFKERRVEFRQPELLKMLGWNDSGASYRRIEDSLDRWMGVTLKYENAWRDNRTKTWTSKEAFHIIDHYELNDGRGTGQLNLLPSFILWNEVIFESFQAGYLKPLDYDFCMSLSNSTAKRMYRFLDKRFHHRPDWTFDLKEFAYGHIGLSKCYEGPAHLKRNLYPAIAELETVGFLEPLADSQRFLKDGREWKIRLIHKGTVSPSPDDASQPALPLTEPEPPLVAALIQRGVTRTTALALVKQSTAERIAAKIEVFDWRMTQPKPLKEPAGYLVKSITDDYAAPKGFLPEAERQAREEAKQAKAREQAGQKRREREEEARQHERRQEEDAYWSKLTPADQAELEAKALDAASESARDTYLSMKRMGAGGGYLSMIRREYIRSLIDARKQVEPA